MAFVVGEALFLLITNVNSKTRSSGRGCASKVTDLLHERDILQKAGMLGCGELVFGWF